MDLKTATADPRLQRSELVIDPLTTVDATVRLPGSKSYTNRAIAIAGLAVGASTIDNALLSQDTLYLAAAVEALGHVRMEYDQNNSRIAVAPAGQPMRAGGEEIYMGNAGTGLRFFITLASLAEGRSVVTGNARMQERPMGDLLDALGPLGVVARSLRGNGSPPVEVSGQSLGGGQTRIRGSVSSQFTSSLLISAPRAEQAVEVTVFEELISKPYVDMTVAYMHEFGVDVERRGYEWFGVRAGQRYTGRPITVEPDASGMSYFIAAAAILDGRVVVPGIGDSSVQGDVGLAHVLTDMGCRVELKPHSITVEGGPLHGVDVDMASMPDVVPTLAVVAAYAQGATRITGIGNLRLKECDRIAAVQAELGRMGIQVEAGPDWLVINGGEPKGAVIDTYDDHRIAMSFAIAGLRTPGVVVRDPGCVTKSFPTFWQTLDGLRNRER
jgi:3-phosphoshikimate 1-carboxyvinyltransferase